MGDDPRQKDPALSKIRESNLGLLETNKQTKHIHTPACTCVHIYIYNCKTSDFAKQINRGDETWIVVKTT